MEVFVKESIDPKSVLFTDKNPAYLNFEKMVDNHIKVKSSYETANGNLNCVHTAISNLKRNLLGIYNLVRENFLKSYLNEFAKFKKRYFVDKFFDRLFIASFSPYVQHSD